ncbi:MAG: 3-hydroxyacyl-CoA dehydrogenase family protein, partial [Deltaproteobacteria bacterium]
MNYSVNRAMVIGSGVMGAGIAAHLANAEIPVYLIDIVPSKLTPEEEKKGLTLENPGVRNRIANQGLVFLQKSKPAGLFSKSKLDLITVGNTEDNFEWAQEADLIIEVVIENLAIKREVMATVDKLRQEKSIISTNTSGIPIHQIAEGRSEGFKAHFLGTHFFNPPRYLKLLELIPTSETHPAVIEFMKAFGERRLGKTVVLCKDTPNFIANRVAVLTGRATLNYVLENDYSVEEVDAITGPLIGHPKTATFRLLDLVGMDVNKHVSANLYEAIAHDTFREHLIGPGNDLTEKMVEAGLLGNKASQGFYKKVKGSDGKKTYRVLNLTTLEYRDQKEPDIPILKKASKIDNLGERMRFLISQQDRFGEFIWHEVALALSYCSDLIPEIADALFSIDDAVRAGFSHELGPFELWDALRVRDTIARMEAEGLTVAPWVK